MVPVNWEKKLTTQLKGSVSSDNIKVEWTCPQNSEVVFKDASNPITEVATDLLWILKF